MGERPRFWVAFSILPLTFAVSVIMAASMVVVKANAQEQQCPLYQDLKAALLEKFNEAPSGSGISEKNSAAIVVFASPDGATWTIAHIGPDGRACPIAVGENWIEVIPPNAPIEGELPS